MSEINPSPWAVNEGEFRGDFITSIEIHDAEGEAILDFMSDEKKLAEHIVKCVNEHDSLIARAEKAENDKLVWFETWEQEKELSKGQKEVLIQRTEKAGAEVEKLKLEISKMKQKTYRYECGGCGQFFANFYNTCPNCGKVGYLSGSFSHENLAKWLEKEREGE